MQQLDDYIGWTSNASRASGSISSVARLRLNMKLVERRREQHAPVPIDEAARASMKRGTMCSVQHQMNDFGRHKNHSEKKRK